MMNSIVDPALLANHIPPGVELDFHESETFISLVALLFLDTRVLGLALPRHRNFEEVNLRFYVRRKSADTWRRGVCFIREIVPRVAIATVARVFYGEPYLALPMKSNIVDRDGRVEVEYGWREARKWNKLAMSAAGIPQTTGAGSLEEFITEHYWGYTTLRDGCSEYRVEHPRWKIWPATSATLKADITTLCGENFAAPFSAPPVSKFIAEGSYVQVWRKSNDPVLAEAMAYSQS
jgi:uncharacterized protein YqjF (DUF2071 family)